MNSTVPAFNSATMEAAACTGAQFLQECQAFISTNSGRKPNEPSTVQDISSLVHLMKCMFTCFAPALEAASKLPQLVAELKQTQEEVVHLRSLVTSLAGNYNDIVRYSYDQNALVHGVEESDGETPDSLRKSVMHVFGTVQAKLKASDLEDVHRLGARKAGKVRPIVCTFFSRSLKRRVVSAFYLKRKTERTAASSPDAARAIRSPVTNHIPFRRLIDLGSLLPAEKSTTSEMQTPERPHNHSTSRKSRLASRRR